MTYNLVSKCLYTKCERESVKIVQEYTDQTRLYKSIQIKQECTTLSVQRCLEYISKCLQDYWSVTECTECLDISILYTHTTHKTTT